MLSSARKEISSGINQKYDHRFKLGHDYAVKARLKSAPCRRCLSRTDNEQINVWVLSGRSVGSVLVPQRNCGHWLTTSSALTSVSSSPSCFREILFVCVSLWRSIHRLGPWTLKMKAIPEELAALISGNASIYAQLSLRAFLSSGSL